MRIEKVFNNNALLVSDLKNNEKFVMGKGIGFKKKPGDTVDLELIEKEFDFQKRASTSALIDIYEQLPPDEIDLVTAIIKEAEIELGQTYLLSLYVSLADHIHYAIEQAREGLIIKNPLAWDVKRFYPKEFSLGKKCVEEIKRTACVAMPEDEAAAIALHFINARQENGIFRNTFEITHLIDEILRIIKLYYKAEVNFDEDSISFQRFITHILYLGQRIFNGLQEELGDSFLLEQVRLNYPETTKCVDKISGYLKESRNFILNTEEKAYLTIHIQRLLKKN